ncbi:hypothetical protein QOT17_003164 [Balamuthia mandrillaris]
MLDPSQTLSSPFFCIPILPFSLFPFLLVYFEATLEIHSRCPSSILLNTLLVSSPTLYFLRLNSTNNSPHLTTSAILPSFQSIKRTNMADGQKSESVLSQVA